MILKSAEIKPVGALNLPHLTLIYTGVTTVEDAILLGVAVKWIFNTGRVGIFYDSTNHTLLIQCFLWEN